MTILGSKKQKKMPKYKIGQKKGKAEVERLDRIRGTDIKKILSKNKKALEWWTSI